jgi:hypothetical protein
LAVHDLNLVVNARDAMPNAGEVTIEAHPEFTQTEVRPGHYVASSSSDTGTAMRCLNAVGARSIVSRRSLRPDPKVDADNMTSFWGI